LTVPVWAWTVFLSFVIAMLALDVLVLHRRAHEVSLREAGAWSAVWIIIGLGFGGLIWTWAGASTAQAYLAGYLIEKSLSVDNIVLFAAIFSAFAIPARHQHRVLTIGIIGALVMRAAFIAAGIKLLEAIHPVIYVFGAVLLVAAVSMLRGGTHAAPEHPRVLRVLRRLLPVTDQLHGQRFVLRYSGHLVATPLLLALVVVETTDVIFAVDSIPAVLAVTTDPFVVYTSNVFALLGMRALYFLLAGAAARLRYLRPGLALILAAVAVKLLLADAWEFPAWSAPAFITAVLAVVAAASIRDNRRAGLSDRHPAEQYQSGSQADRRSHVDGGQRVVLHAAQHRYDPLTEEQEDGPSPQEVGQPPPGAHLEAAGTGGGAGRVVADHRPHHRDGEQETVRRGAG
jgi:TerC family integral membrane protein